MINKLNPKETAKTSINGINGVNNNHNGQKKQLIIWISAMLIGGILGCLGIAKLNNLFNFIATIFTKLFQFIAIPTIALAVITTLSELGTKKNTGKKLKNPHTLPYLMRWRTRFGKRRELKQG